MVESENMTEKEIIRARLKADGKDSAPNSDCEETPEEREQREAKEEKVINYTILGSDACPVKPEDEEIDFSIWKRLQYQIFQAD